MRLSRRAFAVAAAAGATAAVLPRRLAAQQPPAPGRGSGSR